MNSTVLDSLLKVNGSSEEELKKIAKLVQVFPTKLFKNQDSYGRNILHTLVKNNNFKGIETLKKALEEKGEGAIFYELFLTKDLQGNIPEKYTEDSDTQDLLLIQAS